MKPTALEKFLKNHKPTCAVHVYSGDRHCSCGRGAAEKEYLILKALADAKEVATADAVWVRKDVSFSGK